MKSKKIGCPRMYKEPSVVFSTRIDKELDKGIKGFAKSNGGKLSDVQRLIVQSGFEHVTQGRGQ